MAKLLNLSINLSKIDKTKIILGKNGKYLNLTVAVNDEKDNYDNDVSCWQGQTKEEVHEKDKKNYLGNGRVFWTNDNTTTSPEAAQQSQQASQAANELNDDLPF